MAIDKFLSGLHGLRAGRDGRSWTARCPAHQDRSPSLSIRLCEDQRILIHCFAGCSAAEVAAAAGMELIDLMPPRPRDTPDGPGGHGCSTWNIRDPRVMLRAARREALVVAMYLEAQWRGDDLSLEDEDRVMLAIRRLRELAEAADEGGSYDHDRNRDLEDSAVEAARRIGEKNRENYP